MREVIAFRNHLKNHCRLNVNIREGIRLNGFCFFLDEMIIDIPSNKKSAIKHLSFKFEELYFNQI